MRVSRTGAESGKQEKLRGGRDKDAPESLVLVEGGLLHRGAKT